jgi:adenylylsulfate kinase
MSRLESLIKSIVYRLFGTIVTFFIAYFFTREFFIASGIALIEMLAKTILYYAYERFWNKIRRIERVIP